MSTKKKEIKPAISLTNEQLDVLGRAFLRTWDVIGGDILNCNRDLGGEETVSRNEVIECCMDYVRTYGKINDETILRWLNSAGYNNIMNAVKPYFKHELYGW